jgi:iron(III) transport system ATP-binding protein
MTNLLELKNLSVSLDNTPIVQEVSLSLAEGQIGCLLGPSGCGKTTLLRTIAGFLKPNEGQVYIGNKVVSDANSMEPVERRQVGMVFQDYALFPHLSIAENIAFGLNKSSSKEQKIRVNQLAELLDIAPFLKTYPHKLSGGQQQRVALARAIAPSPRLLLLDEPFASLDVVLREQIAREIRQVLQHEGITTMLVSHNQHEAFAMADIIGVMGGGRLLQWGEAFNLYHNPNSPYVADFVGEGVMLKGTVINENSVETNAGTLSNGSNHGLAPGETVRILVRPEDVIVDESSTLKAKVVERVFRGANFLYVLSLEGSDQLLSLETSNCPQPLGSHIPISVQPSRLIVFPST